MLVSRWPKLYGPTNSIIIDCDSNARKGQRTKKFMIIVKASKASEAGEMPGSGLATAMGKYNEEFCSPPKACIPVRRVRASVSQAKTAP